MFVTNLQNEFYNVVQGNGIEELVEAYRDNIEEVSYVILINCGGGIDIVELLEPDERITFFVLDSHRPYDVANIYSEGQIKILGNPDAEEGIPEYNEIYKDDSSEEEEEIPSEDEEVEDGAVESNQAKRRRLNEEIMLKRRERRRWEENRDAIMFHYMQYSFYGRSSAVMVFEMTWKMSRDSLDMAWWAVVGATEQAILSKVENGQSVLEAGNLQGHVSRLSHIRGVDGDKLHQSAIKVTYDKDLQLALYRHWTVESSLRHSMPTAVSLRLWSIRGETRLKELLAEMGLPLAQSKQQFSAMDLHLRQEFKQMMEKLAGKYNIDTVIGASFTLQYGYRFKYCSSDIVYAMLALLESTSKARSPQHCFLDASDCLSRMKKDVLERGIEKAKEMLCNIYKTAQSILEMKQVLNAGTFLYVVLPGGNLDSHLFSHPHALLMLAQFILKAYVECSKSRRAQMMPLVASAVYNLEENTCLVVGIPPIIEDPPRSLFGPAFDKAAKNTNSHIEGDYFDSTIVRLKIEHRPKFFDALAALLIG
ncbi:cell division control protein 45 homolog isoform X2 [Belonocnema kinseyi]|uniref:cell division control protein 45 homolog isoform X2 n=1 Tax=Belonocnema kinseyi TaxID=2817044 RepID=UPI00143D0DC9|nr:cell division control protein 45 homolog isoform X2 [Belonocnema kinseyi]